LAGGLLPDLPGFSVVSPNFAVVAASCRFLPGPTGCQGPGPQSLRAPAFSDLGFPRDRWALELGSPRHRRSSPAPRPAPPGPPRLDESTGVQGPGRLAASSAGDGLAIRPYYLPGLARRDRLLLGRSPGQNAYCTSPGSSHDAGLPWLDGSPLRPRARLLQGRPVRSDRAPRPGDSPAPPRFTTAHSGRPPGPSAGSSARGCSARGTSGATDPGSPT
jgi:hypothetical protein